MKNGRGRHSYRLPLPFLFESVYLSVVTPEEEYTLKKQRV